MNNEKFSKRMGFESNIQPEITIREDAPNSLRFYLPQAYYENGGNSLILRNIICSMIREAPDPNNWGDNSYTKKEIDELIRRIEWYNIYNIIEAIILENNDKLFNKLTFIKKINEFFIEKGIGWKIGQSQIEYRGEGTFETEIQNVTKVLEDTKLITAKKEIDEAIKDLSRRPKPDVTGAVQHSLACLECVMRDITGNKDSTLGALIKEFPNKIPKPLDDSVKYIWGYASQHGRHIAEGTEPDYEEAELLVYVSAAISSYLSKKFKNSVSMNDSDLPF